MCRKLDPSRLAPGRGASFCKSSRMVVQKSTSGTRGAPRDLFFFFVILLVQKRGSKTEHPPTSWAGVQATGEGDREGSSLWGFIEPAERETRRASCAETCTQISGPLSLSSWFSVPHISPRSEAHDPEGRSADCFIDLSSLRNYFECLYVVMQCCTLFLSRICSVSRVAQTLSWS